MSGFVGLYESSTVYRFCFVSLTSKTKTSIGGTNPPVISVADEISPDDRPEFVRSHFFRIIAAIQQF